jgi:putative glutamine amidotransferase
VRISPDSTLARVVPEPGYVDVPTYHHQAVDLLGDGLRAVAWAEDGTVEAVEPGPSELGGLSGFVLGVQWHPEQGQDMRLFGALASAAADRAAARSAADRAAARSAAERAGARSRVLAPMI